MAADVLDGRAGEVRAAAEQVVEDLGDWWGPKRLGARQDVYLVTFAAVLAAAELPLRTLRDVDRETVRAAMVDAANRPQQGRGRPRVATENAVVKWPSSSQRNGTILRLRLLCGRGMAWLATGRSATRSASK